MNIKYYFSSLLVFGFLASGCQDLDTLPEGSTVTETQKEDVVNNLPDRAEASVNAIFAQFNQFAPNKDALGSERHNDIGYPSIMLFTDANGNDVVSSNNGYNWTANDMRYDDRSITSNESQIVWNDLYSMIFAANNVIKSIGPKEKNSQNKFYLAQGYASRAFNYFLLAQLYQFNYVGHEELPCVPIITDENSETAAWEGCSRSTVKQVYDLISSDISKAITLLIDADNDGILRNDKRYISLDVAYGIRARINLTMQKWSDAANDATKAIELSSAKPASISDVNKPYFWNIDENDWMWGIIVAETDRVVTTGICNWPSHMGSLNFGYANYSGGFKINKKLYNSIESTDVRKGWWLDENCTSPNIEERDDQKWLARAKSFVKAKRYKAYTQVKFAPYNEVIATSTNANDIPLMRIEEMYLIKAEGEAMSGANGKATLEAFVKQYRNPQYVCNASSKEDIQEEIFRQRRIELWGEGLNWYDIMRLNKGVDRRGGGYPDATMIFNIPAGNGSLLWRLPEAEIQANQKISNSDNNPTVVTPTPVPDND